MIEIPQPESESYQAVVSRERSTSAAATWLGRVLLAAALALATALCLTAQPSWDLWWQMKIGELILQTGRVPKGDPFSFTASDRPWMVQEWLVAVLFFLLHHHLGPLALIGFKLLAAGTAFALLMVRALRRSGDAMVTAALVVLAAVAARWHVDLRPQLVSFVLLGALLLTLDARRAWYRGSGAPAADRWLRWAPAAILMLWVNCHAMFVIGLGIVAACTADAWWHEARRRTWLAEWGVPALAALVATLINPYGYHALLYPVAWLAANMGTAGTGVWASPDFHSRPAQGLELVLLVWLWAAAFSRRRLAGWELGIVLLLALFALVSAPLAPYFVFATVPWLAGLLRRAPERAARVVPQRAAALAAVLALLAVIAVRAPRGDWFAVLAQTAELPAAACDRIRAEGWSEGLLAEREWGGYCAWRFFPQRVVFADNRLEIYPPDVAEDFMACMNAFPDSEQRLARRGIRTLLLRRDSIAARFTEQSPYWRCAYSDRHTMVFRRREAPAGQIGN